MKDNVQASQTVLMGDLVFGSTLWKNLCPGIPPSRAKAYIIRELDVIENTLARCGLLAATKSRGGGGGPPAEVHAPDDDHHQNDGTFGAYRIKEDLGYRLAGWGVERSGKILNRKQQPKDEEPPQNRGDTDGHDNADGSGHGGIMGFLRHLHPGFSLQRGGL